MNLSIFYAFCALCVAAVVFILLYEDNHRPVVIGNRAEFKNSFIKAVKNSKPKQVPYRKRYGF